MKNNYLKLKIIIIKKTKHPIITLNYYEFFKNKN